MATRTKKQTAVVVRRARYAQGYSGTDHLHNHGDLDAIVGRVYPSEQAARQAAEELSTESVPVWVDCLPVDTIPKADIDAAINRCHVFLEAKGGAVCGGVRADECPPFMDNGYLKIAVPLDHGPDESTQKTGWARVYRA